MIGKPLTSSGAIPKTRTESRPTALATRSQYRSRVARSGARMSCSASISIPSMTARKSSRLRSNRRTGSRSGGGRGKKNPPPPGGARGAGAGLFLGAAGAV